MLLTKCVCYVGVVWLLWESQGTIKSPTQELVTEEGKDTRYEIKRFEVDIGVMLLIGRLRVNPHPKAYRLTKCRHLRHLKRKEFILKCSQHNAGRKSRYRTGAQRLGSLFLRFGTRNRRTCERPY
jgi:hypothetical protein